MAAAHFTKDYFKFFSALKKNNNREWFNEHKKEYELFVKEPLLNFVSDFAPHLEKISPHFVASPKGNGGSMFRIYRDTRFSKDKTPYKTNGALHFRHEVGKDAHAPGFYLGIEEKEIFAGTGLWKPDSDSLRAIRQRIVDEPALWKKCTGGKIFKAEASMWGDALKRPPKGFDPEHPLIEDLKRKDFVASIRFDAKEALEPGFIKKYAKVCKTLSPFTKFLTEACGHQF